MSLNATQNYKLKYKLKQVIFFVSKFEFISVLTLASKDASLGGLAHKTSSQSRFLVL